MCVCVREGVCVGGGRGVSVCVFETERESVCVCVCVWPVAPMHRPATFHNSCCPNHAVHKQRLSPVGLQTTPTSSATTLSRATMTTTR